MPRTPSAFPFSGRLRRRTINPTPPKRVKAWGEGPLRPEVMYPVVEHTRPNRAARNHSRSRAPHHRTQENARAHFLSAVCDLKKRVYFQRLMLLRVYSNRFLRNHTGKVVPRVLPSCWKLSRFRPNPTWCISRRGLKTIRGNFQTTASDSYFWKKRNDWVSYKTTTTNLNWNHMAYPTLFHAVGTQCLVAVFFPRSCASSRFSSQGTVNSMRMTLFFQSDHATMSGRFSVWIMWTGNCRDVLRSAETFQSLAPFSSFMLGFYTF